MERCRCVIKEVTFQSPDNGYSILKASVDGNPRQQKIVGYFFNVGPGTELLVDGEWEIDKRYGRQFKAQSWEETMPATLKGIEKYLCNAKVPGIGPKMAREIVSRFGLDTFDIIENNIERLREVPGIGTNRIEKIKKSWERRKDVRDIMVFLQGYGVSANFAVKIYNKYGKDSIEMVIRNPYSLADDIWGVGFKSADRIALNMGYTLNDPRRCKSGIVYTLKKLSEEGHVYANANQLIEKAKELLSADEQAITTVIDKMIKSGELIIEKDAIFLPSLYKAECETAGKLKSLADIHTKNIFGKDIDVEEIIKNTETPYDDTQLSAIRLSFHSNIMVLTGGPGTGKTTTTLGIIFALKSAGKDVLLAAPTGRAAKRLSEATKTEAVTIHRLLEYNPEIGFKRNLDNPLEGDALIVDECSMIDISLMNSLLKAVPYNMKLVLVGDIDQLPSVGAGNVLRDIIESGRVPVIRLTRIFRQAQNSRIITNAHKINNGCIPDISNGKEADFFFIKMEDPEMVANEIVNLVKNRIPKGLGMNVNDIQVLTPMRKGQLGAISLNNALQEAINPDGDSMSHGGYVFREGDRVMQIRNNYDKNVFNGDIGIVEKINLEMQSLFVRYNESLVEYESFDLDELVLAYATTIHKSQGSEYPVVVIPVLMTHFIMLQRNLIYTAITRAKRLCILIGTTKALAYAVKNQEVLKRNTKLKERLRS